MKLKRKFNNVPNKSYNVDGKIIWDSRSVAVVACILADYHDELYILIGQRGTGVPDSVGKYNLVCGYMDKYENGRDAVEREVYEETGLDLSEWDIIQNDLDEPWSVNTEPTENRQNIVLRYGCVIKVHKLPELTSEYSEPNEVSDLRWIKYQDIDNYDWAFNHDIIIRKYFQRL